MKKISRVVVPALLGLGMVIGGLSMVPLVGSSIVSYAAGESSPSDAEKAVNVTVADESGNGVAYVTIQVKSDAYTDREVTDESGKAAFVLEDGVYEVTVYDVPRGYKLSDEIKKMTVTNHETSDSVSFVLQKEDVQQQPPQDTGSGHSITGGWSNSGSGYSGGQSGGQQQDSSSAGTPVTSIQTDSSAVSGTWSYNEETDIWTLNDGQYKSQWVYVEDAGRADWFAFDENGNMRTGWFQDGDGLWYYLNERSDGTKGAMLTGWQWVDGKCYCLSDGSDGPKGHMLAATTTPDGYTVNESGEWVVDGVVVTQ